MKHFYYIFLFLCTAASCCSTEEKISDLAEKNLNKLLTKRAINPDDPLVTRYIKNISSQLIEFYLLEKNKNWEKIKEMFSVYFPKDIFTYPYQKANTIMTTALMRFCFFIEKYQWCQYHVYCLQEKYEKKLISEKINEFNDKIIHIRAEMYNSTEQNREEILNEAKIIYATLALLYAKKKDWACVEKMFIQYFPEDIFYKPMQPGNPDIYFALGLYHYYKCKDFTTAELYLKDILNVSKNEHLNITLGRMYYAQEEYQKAQLYFDEAQKIIDDARIKRINSTYDPEKMELMQDFFKGDPVAIMRVNQLSSGANQKTNF